MAASDITFETWLRDQVDRSGLRADVDPLNFGVAGGDIRSVIRMDGRESPIRTRAQISARGLNLAREVIRYVTDKYGKDNVGQIATFHQLKSRGLLRSRQGSGVSSAFSATMTLSTPTNSVRSPS